MDNLLDNASGVPLWIVIPVFLALWVVALMGVKKLAFARIRAFAARTTSEIDDVLVKAISLPATILIFASGLFLVERILPLDPNWDKGVQVAFGVAGLLAAVLFFDRLIRELIRYYSSRFEFLEASRGILVGLSRAVIISIAIVIFLDSMGVSITPLVASLGIGSLAVALALRDTLANFFAGLQVLADKPVAMGDFVKLETGEEGYVTKIGWRSTRVRLLNDNLVIVPNIKLTDGVITNYSLPDKEVSIVVQVGVHYRSDLERVEAVVSEVAREVMRSVEGGMPEFEPFVRFHTFADSSVNFSVILRGREFVDSYRIKHEFIKLLHSRFRQEGIVIPFPIRTLEVGKETLAAVRERGEGAGGSGNS